ncbi:MAG: hypothetical protein ABGX69_05580 [Methylococcales bacterium]|jgi:ABC-type transport system involved in multi-copper enzyme maturation permease subunit|nr:hypothetical protein [Methylococcales bacterium]
MTRTDLVMTVIIYGILGVVVLLICVFWSSIRLVKQYLTPPEDSLLATVVSWIELFLQMIYRALRKIIVG